VQQVFGFDGEIGDLDRFGVGGAENASAGDAGAGESDGPGFVVMVATGSVVDLGSAAEFALASTRSQRHGREGLAAGWRSLGRTRVAGPSS
jgi:hypothetical protein